MYSIFMLHESVSCMHTFPGKGYGPEDIAIWLLHDI